MRPARLARLLVVAIAALAPSAGAASEEVLTCAACSPDRLVLEANKAMVEALRFQLKAGRVPEDRPAIFLVAAREHAEQGRTQDALPLARRAAAECVLTGEDGCAETLAFLAELTLADGGGKPELEDEALAYLSLLPYERLGSRLCVEAVTLRYRLSERRSPRAAEPAWADRCGALGRIGEPGYRAAKAAVLKGEYDDAATRLAKVRAFNHEYGVRATYLFAVIEVARGNVNAAQRAFQAIVALPPSELRSEEEDDARMLAALQLARVERERGEYEAALAAYQTVPSRTVPRAEALLEGAVVAAHVGDMGAAANYLAALERYQPQTSQLVEMQRLKANLAVVNGREEDAEGIFRDLTALGRKARAETFGPAAPDPQARLVEDPTLNGLLDPRDATRVTTAELEVKALRTWLDEGRADLGKIKAELEQGGPEGPLKRALEKLEGADVLLRRAENLLARRESDGLKLAGPADAALSTFREAQEVRRRLDEALRSVRGQHQAQRAFLVSRLVEVERDLQTAERRLLALEGEAAEVVRRRRELLVQRAEGVVQKLEISEDLGLAELAWQRKQRASLGVKRANEEYNEAMATLRSDSGISKTQE